MTSATRAAENEKPDDGGINNEGRPWHCFFRTNPFSKSSLFTRFVDAS
jgi:hypothetical protein